MRLIPVEYLKPNTQVAVDVLASNGVMMLSGGQTLTERMVSKLKDGSLDSIFVMDEYCSNTTPNPCIASANISAIETCVERLTNLAKKLLQGSANSQDIVVVVQMAYAIVDEGFAKSDLEFTVNYEPIKMYQGSIIEKCLHATIVALALGIKMGLNHEQLIDLAMAGLLKDFVLAMPELCDEDAEEVMKTHALIAYRILRQHTRISKSTLEAIIQHKEKLDGTGQPYQKSGDEICLLARILAVIDYFYELKTRENPIMSQENFEEIFMEELKQFDVEVVTVFLANVELFSLDCLVVLSNGDVAVVTKYNFGQPFQPEIKIVRSVKYPTDTILDLSDANFGLRVSHITYLVA